MYSATIRTIFFLAALASAGAALADERPLPLDAVQVTATREELPLLETPASVTIVTGDELRARGANDLRTALIGVSGVEISPGGESGPAGAVPAIWGLREFDAFLLVVDDVPYGGAFNPALTALDLHDIARIEVLRGAAPVMYGATSFVGVIHVIHNPGGQSERRVNASVGGVPDNAGNVSASVSESLPDLGNWHQSIDVDGERRRYADEQAGLERGHALWRLTGDLGGGTAHLDVDLNALRQNPTSPYPRSGDGLDPTIDTDANHNPADAKLDQNRGYIALGYLHDTGAGAWKTTFALTKTKEDIVRGFLADECVEEPLDGEDNACGFRQDRELTDVYFDTHFITEIKPGLTAVWGVDDLYGKGKQDAELFAYDVNRAHGNDAPSSSEVLAEEEGLLEANGASDKRNFVGLYGQLDWHPTDRLDVLFGVRLNSTDETREGEVKEDEGAADDAGDDEGDEEAEGGREKRSHTRVSGSVGVSWTAWSSGDGDTVALFTDYRNTFKPAAIDFGPEPEADILDPETARSVEVGTKTRWLGGRLGIDVSGFYMSMNNLVVPQAESGEPGLANAGTLHFKGGEIEADWRVADAATVYAGYARHDLRFGDYVRAFDGVDTQLRGNYQELAPRNTGSLGFTYAPVQGWQVAANYSYTGSRFLNKRNTSKASSFEVVDASLGYRFQSWMLRLSGYNLTDSRDPVSESELGDGQYYRMPARSLELGVSVDL
jgi:iron complex outermembrane recepter protein